jgi:response regulator RpfG family c-di-GMP phosphodiesterase
MKEGLLSGVLAFVLESYFKCTVHTLHIEQDAVKLLKNEEHGFDIVIWENDPFSYFLEDLKKTINKFSRFRTFVLVEGEYGQNVKVYEKEMGLRLFKKEDLPLGIIREIQNAAMGADILNSSQFCRMPIKLLLKFEGIKKNLYIKIGSERMVHIIKEDDKTDVEDILKYHKKGIEYLYVKRATAESITTQIQRQIKVYLKANNFKFMLKRSTDTEESLYEQRIIRINDEIFIDDELKNIIQETVLTIKNKAMGEKRIDLFMSHLMNMPNHFAFYGRKVELTSMFACLIVDKLQWNSSGTNEKIVYAAVLSDITLAVRPKLLQIRDLDEFNVSKDSLNPEDHDFFLNHPRECASLTSKFFQSAPAETSLLVLQQHEQPDGKGFPHGLKASNISPLSAVFIIASDISHYILTTEHPSIDDYLEETRSRWDFVNFRKAYRAIVEMRQEKARASKLFAAKGG